MTAATSDPAGSGRKKGGRVVRFSVRQRWEHFLIMLLFIVLAVTGLPQSFSEAAWAQWLIPRLGGIDRARWLHRVCGLLFTFAAVEHLAVVVLGVATRRIALSMVPAKKDFRDAIVTLKYYLGVSAEEAAFDRYDYRQKFEYWGLVLGGTVMIVTGLILYFPIEVTHILPGQVIPASKVAHSSEGLLAFLIIIIWHVYNAHLSPDVFPFDPSIFTGTIDEERMRKEHPLEYARLFGGTGRTTPAEPASAGGDGQGPDNP